VYSRFACFRSLLVPKAIGRWCGSGQDTIHNLDETVGRVDVLQIGAGVTAAQVTLSLSGSDVILGITGTSDRITLSGVLNDDGVTLFGLNQVRFADSTIWTIDTVKARLLVGTAAAETIEGYATADTISAAGRNDIVYGMAGNDTLDRDSIQAGSTSSRCGSIVRNTANARDGCDRASCTSPTEKADPTQWIRWPGRSEKPK